MTDREIFRENLNYYLNKYNKLQKELADYVGAKTTTVSGWTRGISYPRIEAMEKIAMFFGVPTSELVGKRADQKEQEEASANQEEPKNDNVRLLIRGLNKMTPEQIERATAIMKAAFIEYADYFEKGNDDDDA